MREPLFILTSHRSFSSVIGTMLGQHPQAYGLPEVNLSHGETLGEMFNSILNQRTVGTAGLLRALAELHEGDQSEAAIQRAMAWVARHGDWTGRQVFDHLHDLIGTDRMFIDKSPRNSTDISYLRRLARDFPRANYLHLTRHPRSMCKSAMSLIKEFSSGRAVIDPETRWLQMHTNNAEFMRELAPGQAVRIKGEALLTEPQFYLRQICEWLDIDSGDAAIAAILRPEESPFAMVGPPSAPYGADPNFLKEPKLDFARLAKIKEDSLDGPLEWNPGKEFSQPVKRLALQLGYI